MPLYEYKCDGCGDVFELIQKFSDAPLTVHEKCGGPVHRLVSTSALHFKGSGWYITDYAKKNGKSSEKSEKSEKSDKSEKSETKASSDSGSKSETKSDSSTTSSAPTTKSEN